MGYWIYMTCVSLLVPIIIISIGSYVRKCPPMQINAIYGYRTKLSMRNQDTWEFANIRFGRLAFKWGWIMLIVTIIVMLLVLYRSQEVISCVSLTVIALQVVPPIAIIPVVEQALKDNFNTDGSRK